MLGFAVCALALYRQQPAWLRAWWFCLGQVIVLTAPLAGVLNSVFYGDYPTIDKAGSVAFYLAGVHQTLTFHPISALSDPACQLIGVHMGHLWVTAFFDLFLHTPGAFNIQALVYPALAWWAAGLLLRNTGVSWPGALGLAFSFGMGLHLFRDLNWYTIEKSAVFSLALFFLVLWKAREEGGRWIGWAALAWVGMAFLNWYLGLVGALGAAFSLLIAPNRRLLKACVACGLLGIPLVLWQILLLSGEASPSDPEIYLTHRAMQDVFTLWPPAWNRLEAWRALDPVVFGLAILFLGVVIIFGYSRVVAEGGLSDGSPPVVPAGILVSAVGSSIIGVQGLVVLATTFMWTTGRNFVMVSAANSLRLGEELGKNRRPLFWIIVLALAVAMGAALWMVMLLSHKYGAINLWLWGGGNYGYVEKFIRTPSEPYGWGWFNMGLGALIMTGLMAARWFYLWWPLHPLGYVIGPIWIMDHLWVNMFIAWLIKVLVLKYGGVRLYLKTRPFFMGMILGYFTPGGFYLIIDHFTGMTWNVIFWG